MRINKLMTDTFNNIIARSMPVWIFCYEVYNNRGVSILTQLARKD